MTEKLNKKKRRPTEIKNKSNNSEYTASITEGDSVNSMEECTMYINNVMQKIVYNAVDETNMT